MNVGSACRIGLWEGNQLKTVECSLHGGPHAIGKVLIGYDQKEVRNLLYEGDLVLLGESSWSSIYHRRQLGKSNKETQAMLYNNRENLFRQNRHVKHLYVLESNNVWYYYERCEAGHHYLLKDMLPWGEKHMYRVFMYQKARSGEENKELVAYESAQCEEEAAYLAARDFQLYRNNLVAVQCYSSEEYLLGHMLKRWKVADKNNQVRKPPYWSGLAVAEDEALAIAKVCWQHRTVLDVDRGYRWCNPAAVCISAAL